MADLICSSPIFDIDPNESYVIGCTLSKDSDTSSTNDPASPLPIYDGVGIRLTYYDDNATLISPISRNDVGTLNHDPRLNHLITSSNNIPVILDSETGTDGINIINNGRSLIKTIDSTTIPSSGTKAKLEAVAYDHLQGKFYWNNLFIKTKGEYYYSKTDHNSTDNPFESENWTLDFNHNPSYGSSVKFFSENDILQKANGYIEVKPKNLNHISAQFDLVFNNRSKREADAITQFLENHAGSREFNFTPPAPYNKKLKAISQNFSVDNSHKNSYNISATFLVDNLDPLNWKNSIMNFSGSWDSSVNYERNNYIQALSPRSGSENYYYAISPSINQDPKTGESWTNDYFYWTPSDGQTIDYSPRSRTIEFEDGYTKKYDDGLNANKLYLKNSYQDRSDAEASAISHFLLNKNGHRNFELLLPDQLSNRSYPEVTGELKFDSNILISGEQSISVELSKPIDIPREISYFNIDQKIIFDEIESTKNNVFLSKRLNDGDSSMNVRSMFYADIQNGSKFTINAGVSQFYCNEWTHRWNFKNNNTITTNFYENPYLKSRWKGRGFSVTPNPVDFGTRTIYGNVIRKRVEISNTGIETLTISDIKVISDGEFYISDSNDGSSVNYDLMSLPFDIAGDSTEVVYIAYYPTGHPTHPNLGFTGSGIFTIDGHESGIYLTGSSDSYYITTGFDLIEDSNDNPKKPGATDISPSGLTQIVVSEFAGTVPIDLLVWDYGPN